MEKQRGRESRADKRRKPRTIRQTQDPGMENNLQIQVRPVFILLMNQVDEASPFCFPFFGGNISITDLYMFMYICGFFTVCLLSISNVNLHTCHSILQVDLGENHVPTVQDSHLVKVNIPQVTHV